MQDTDIQQPLQQQQTKQKPPKDGYKIITCKSGKQMYRKILSDEQANKRKETLTKQLKEKALPKIMNRTQQRIEEIHSHNNEDIKTIREQMDSMSNLIKNVAVSLIPQNKDQPVQRTNSAQQQQSQQQTVRKPVRSNNEYLNSWGW